MNDEVSGVWARVIDDMRQRAAEGVRRYGRPLEPYNGRDALLDLYEELLDACVYLKQVMEERDVL